MSQPEQQVCFDTLYRMYYPKLVRFATHYVVVPQEAENIVQNFFLRLLENRRGLEDVHNVGGYLFRGVRNGCIDFLRAGIEREKRRSSLDETGIREMAFKMEAIERFDEFDATELSAEQMIRLVEGAVESLPQKCREIFVMSRMEGLMHEQIADRLGISPSTVNNQISKALKKFKKEFFLPGE